MLMTEEGLATGKHLQDELEKASNMLHVKEISGAPEEESPTLR
ncbi:hypothetical protein [Sporisorium scitamineum]|uniref:Uncharacterized protein n=1 Tax=Sporisorium scitamineum TaxID=49012 RepID=A0A0F7S768_9BASI|nr:hypothetical protein [Sporisorium scitamineum]